MARSHFFPLFVLVSAMGMSACAPSPRIAAPASTVPPTTAGPTEEKVTFKSGGLTLEGFLYKPVGNGPFPALVWNHGREAHPDEGSEFDSIAAAFVPHGYVVFAPVRRGQGGSEGESIQDEIDEERAHNGEEVAEALFAHLMGTEQLSDQLAGLAYLQTRPYIDKSRIAAMGCADGGGQAILGAASNAGYRAAVAISPVSDDWTGNTPLQRLMFDAVDRITNVPVYLMHPSGDVSKDPGKSLAAEFERLGKPYRLKLFTPFGTPEQLTECFGGAGGVDVWKGEAQIFLGQVLQ